MSHVKWLLYGIVAISLGLWQKKTKFRLMEKINLGEARRVLKDYYAKLTSEDAKYLLSDPIPPDVLIDIVSRLPAKSVVKCRFVSKLWASILGRSELDELFWTMSLTRPQILIALKIDNKYAFSTLPQLQNPNHDDSLSLVATHLHTHQAGRDGCWVTQPVCGLVCFDHDYRKTFVIYNPTTRKSLTVPKPETKMRWAKIIFGYDPVGKQFKVLCLAYSQDDDQPFYTLAKHYVLTLGTEPMGWRMINCCKPRPPIRTGGRGRICINGVLHYVGRRSPDEGDFVIVCFDVRFEKFSFINQPKDLRRRDLELSLINHKGKLCILRSSQGWEINGLTTFFSLWVLKDTEKHEWETHFYKLPPMWRNIAARTDLFIVGMTGTCEIVLSPRELEGHFYLFYYNFEMNIVRRVEIRGFEAFKQCTTVALCSLDYVENMKLI